MPKCWSRHSIWRESEPAGTIWSYTTYERALHPDLELAIPYTVAFIELDSGPIIPGRIHTDENTTIAVGARVTGSFTDVDSEFTMLEWALEDWGE